MAAKRADKSSKPLHGYESDSSFTPESTTRARELFVTSKSWPSMPVSGVRGQIFNSWQRCKELNIDPGQFGAPAVQSMSSIDQVRNRNHDMVQAALPTLQKVSGLLIDSDVMMTFTDANGLVLEAVGDPKALETGRRINLQVGGMWGESQSGTNGIGTTLALGMPTFVHGAEHFCEGMQSWSCFGAPIIDPLDQSVIGVADLPGLTPTFSRHNIGLAATVAGEIALQLKNQLLQLQLQLLDAGSGVLNPGVNKSEALVLLDDKGRIIFSRNFNTVLRENGLPENFKIGQKLAEVDGGLDENKLTENLALEMAPEDARQIQIDGKVKGMALVFSGSGKRRKPASNRPKHSAALFALRNGMWIVGRSKPFRMAIEFALRTAKVSTPVLIQGETGTGKMLVASLISEQMDPDKQVEVVKIECRAAEKNAFLSDILDKLTAGSRIADAGRGSDPSKSKKRVVVLRNPEFLSLASQSVLYAWMNKHNLPAHFDDESADGQFRIITLATDPLFSMVQNGQFSSDLYYRLNGLVLKLPPLRERDDDVLLLVDYFNQTMAEDLKKPKLEFEKEVSRAFATYRWPGNTMELRNCIASLHFAKQKGPVKLGDLPPEIASFRPLRRKPGGLNLEQVIQPGNGESLKDAEKVLIASELSRFKGNISKTARALGISRPTLYRKLKLHSLRD